MAERTGVSGDLEMQNKKHFFLVLPIVSSHDWFCAKEWKCQCVVPSNMNLAAGNTGAKVK